MTEYVEIHCEIVHTTDNAVLVNDGLDEKWVPYSCINGGAKEIELETGNSIDLAIAYWFAKKNDMI